MNRKIRVLIVDDSALMRKMIRDILKSDPQIEVIATARDGEDGLIKARELQPDVVTLDINMPGMDGLTVLQHILNESICPVVMVSSLTQEGALTTLEALELGAFDYVPKPGGTVSLNLKSVSQEIIDKVKAASKSNIYEKIKKRVSKVRQKTTEKFVSHITEDTDIKNAVAIGVSTGGPGTLQEIIPFLPEDLEAAVFIVQHMPANFTASFAKRLNSMAKFLFKEAEGGDTVYNTHGYLGKGGYHLLLRNRLNKISIRLSTNPEHLFVPSVDIMMESVLSIFGKNTVGVLLTGMGDDGAEAMVKIRNAGGITIAESEETAIVFGMPMEAIKRGGADVIAPSYKIADEIVKAVKSL